MLLISFSSSYKKSSDIELIDYKGLVEGCFTLFRITAFLMTYFNYLKSGLEDFSMTFSSYFRNGFWGVINSRVFR